MTISKTMDLKSNVIDVCVKVKDVHLKLYDPILKNATHNRPDSRS